MGSYYYDKRESTYNNSKSKSYEIGLGIILGFAYKINTDFVVSAEIVPDFFYNYNETESYNAKSYGFKFYNEYAGITIGYRF